MKNNIAKLFGHKARKVLPPSSKIEWVLPAQLIGVEVEVEFIAGTKPPEQLFPYWNRHVDGSLRRGEEYTLISPLAGSNLSEAISNFFHGTNIHRSVTGSTHIHLDMMEEGNPPTLIQILVLLAYSLESAIFAIADKGREWCGYTNKLSTAPDELIAAALNFNEEKGFEDFISICKKANSSSSDINRYYGFNMAALSKYGSIEWRYFPTAVKAEELISWIQLVQSFKRAALDLANVDNLIAIFSKEQTYEAFIRSYFSEWADMFLQEVPYWSAKEGLRKALAIAAANENKPTHALKFNSAILYDNPRYKEFVPNKFIEPVKSTGQVPVFVIRRNDSAPDFRTIEHGSLLLIDSGRVYLSHRTLGWLNFSRFIDIEGIRDITLPLLESIQNTIENRTWYANPIWSLEFSETYRREVVRNLNAISVDISRKIVADGDGSRHEPVEVVSSEPVFRLSITDPQPGQRVFTNRPLVSDIEAETMPTSDSEPASLEVWLPPPIAATSNPLTPSSTRAEAEGGVMSIRQYYSDDAQISAAAYLNSLNN